MSNTSLCRYVTYVIVNNGSTDFCAEFLTSSLSHIFNLSTIYLHFLLTLNVLKDPFCK